MARRFERTPFDPNRPVFARKPFTSGGRKLLPGDRLDWKRLSISQRRIRQMYDGGYLIHKDEEPQPAPEPAPLLDDPKPVTSETSEAPEPEDELDAIESMAELREIAKTEGAEFKVSKVQQREAIRANRVASE